jgi:hypothetical protein
VWSLAVDDIIRRTGGICVGGITFAKFADIIQDRRLHLSSLAVVGVVTVIFYSF